MISQHAFLMSIRTVIQGGGHNCEPYLCYVAQELYGLSGKWDMQNILEEVYPRGYEITLKANYGFTSSLEFMQYAEETGGMPPCGWTAPLKPLLTRMNFIEMMLQRPDRMTRYV